MFVRLCIRVCVCVCPFKPCVCPYIILMASSMSFFPLLISIVFVCMCIHVCVCVCPSKPSVCPYIIVIPSSMSFFLLISLVFVCLCIHVVFPFSYFSCVCVCVFMYVFMSVLLNRLSVPFHSCLLLVLHSPHTFRKRRCQGAPRASRKGTWSQEALTRQGQGGGGGRRDQRAM